MSTDPLLQPLQLKHMALRNRIMSTSHEPAYAEDAKPKLRYQLYHEEKAKGGIALTMFGGSTNVAADSPPVFGQLYAGDDDIIPYFQQLADRVHAHGAYTMCQLTHMGRRTISDAGDWLPTVSPSSTREHAHRSFPKAMESFDIRRIVRSYADAARRCQQGGLDGIELIAYGHLIDQFWSPLVNTRTDRYGGTLGNRMRFGLEVLEAVRDAVGDDFVVGLRMVGDEDREGGLTKDDGITIATTMVGTGMLDFVNVIKGWIATDKGIAKVIPGMGTPLGPHLPLAAAIKDAVDVPVFHAARIADLDTARHAIGQGLLDMVGMTRAHMADPHIVAKLERGEADRIRPCVGASYCINRLYQGLDALCIHNPATGREETIPHVVPRADTPRRVVVVGGGPGGLEAARVCAERGHTVSLLEASSQLGGQVNLAARASERRRELIGITDWLASEVKAHGVDVQMGVLAEATDVRALDPDVVLVATGGWPRIPLMDAGADLVTTTWEVISGEVAPRGHILVYDDHGTEEAMSVVERLLGRPAVTGVEMVTPDRHVGHEVTGTAYPQWLELLYSHGVVMTPDHRLRGVTRRDGRLVVTFGNDYSGRDVQRVVDMVVVENGTEPMVEVYLDLLADSINAGELDLDDYLAGRPQTVVTNPGGTYRLLRLGDAVASRNIHAAIYEARRIGMVL